MRIELFPCSGGMAEGFRRAGVVFDLAFDADPDACASYEANHGHRPIQMDVRDLLRMVRAGWRPAPIVLDKIGQPMVRVWPSCDLIVADPPCTPWSRAGKRRGTSDERDMLLSTVELILLLRPRRYLIGNVPGLDDAPNWPIVQRALAPLARAGYCVADFWVGDAADFGVPQHRFRPFWFGHLDGRCIRWPSPTHGDPVKIAAAGEPLPGVGVRLRSWVTCREALGHLPAEELGRPVRLRRGRIRDNGTEHEYWSNTDEPAKVITTHPTSRTGITLAIPTTRHAPCSPDSPAPTITAGGNGHGPRQHLLTNEPPVPRARRTPRTPQSARAQELSAPARTVRAGRSWGAGQFKWPWDRPSTVVQSDPRISPPGHHDDEEYATRSMPDAVVLSERAAAILQGFPDPGEPGGWRFIAETKTARWSMIGQAMPPALAEAIARAVVEQMAVDRGAT